ncbi:THAP domain-containing protein 1-like [Ostrinia nubilalis]|uniref:THAP domain-containing protein 1-like n=1 Tax=Ostrinia nubilalis TaxID=29057 RepID=UPI0030826A32
MSNKTIRTLFYTVFCVISFAVMVNCCIIGCKSRSERKEPNITFHRFPNEPSLRNKWTECTGRVHWHPSQHSRICSRHFESRCFQAKKKGIFLRQSAKPTLFIHDTVPQHDQPGSSKKPLEIEIQAFESLPIVTSVTTTILPPEDIAMEIEIENTMPDAASMTDDVSVLPPEVAMEIEIEKNMTPKITPRKKKLIKKLEKTTAVGEKRKKKLAALRSKTWRLQKKTAEMCTVIQELKTRSLINQESADLLSSIDVVNRDFLKKFLCKDSTARKYTPELRKFALTLHYISPKAYNFVGTVQHLFAPYAYIVAMVPVR